MIPFLPELPAAPALPLPASALPDSGAGAGAASGGGPDFAALLGAAALPPPPALLQGTTAEDRALPGAASLPFFVVQHEAAPISPRGHGQETPAPLTLATLRLPDGRTLPDEGEILPPPAPQAAPSQPPAADVVAPFRSSVFSVLSGGAAPATQPPAPTGDAADVAGVALRPASGPIPAPAAASAPVMRSPARGVDPGEPLMAASRSGPQPVSAPARVGGEAPGTVAAPDVIAAEAPRQPEPAEPAEATGSREPEHTSAHIPAAPEREPVAPSSPPVPTLVTQAVAPEPSAALPSPNEGSVPAPFPVPLTVTAAAPVTAPIVIPAALAGAGALAVPASGADAPAPAKVALMRGPVPRGPVAILVADAVPASLPPALPDTAPALPEAGADALPAPASGTVAAPAAPSPAIPVPLPHQAAPASQPAAEPRPSDPSAPVETAIAQAGTLREALRAQRPEMVVRHEEFGMISLRLEPAAPDQWRAVLASRDPGFVPAIQAALAERALAPLPAATDSGTGMGQNGTGEQRYGASPNGGQGSSQPYLGQSGGRDGEAAPDHRRPSTAAALAARAGEPEEDAGSASRAPGGLFA